MIGANEDDWKALCPKPPYGLSPSETILGSSKQSPQLIVILARLSQVRY
jgi:hypothetical protein